MYKDDSNIYFGNNLYHKISISIQFLEESSDDALWCKLLAKRLVRCDNPYKKQFKVNVDNDCCDLVDGTCLPPNLRAKQVEQQFAPMVHQLPRTPPTNQTIYIRQSPGQVLSTYDMRQVAVAAQSTNAKSVAGVSGTKQPIEDAATASASTSKEDGSVGSSKTYHQLQTVQTLHGYPNIPPNATSAMYRGRPTSAYLKQLEHDASPCD